MASTLDDAVANVMPAGFPDPKVRNHRRRNPSLGVATAPFESGYGKYTSVAMFRDLGACAFSGTIGYFEALTTSDDLVGVTILGRVTVGNGPLPKGETI